MNTEVLNIENPDTYEIIIGQGNFSIKTIDDIYNAVFSSVPGVKFGAAMNEAKPKLTRVVGNDATLKDLAAKTCLKIGAGHVFVVYIKEAFPIHVLNAIKQLPTVANVYVATSNDLQVLVATTDLGRSIIGVVDGSASNAIETEEQRKERRDLVKKIGFMPD